MVNRDFFYNMSAIDDEDAFDPMDLSLEDVQRLYPRNPVDSFAGDYAAHYDDVKDANSLSGKNDTANGGLLSNKDW